MMLEKLVIFGAGGHAKVVIDAVMRQGRFDVAFLADSDAARVGSVILGYPVREEAEGFAALAAGVKYGIIAIGDNATRRRIAEMVRRNGLTLAKVIHPSAVVACATSIGDGTLVMPGSIINAEAHIGANVIVNTGAVIEHDCVIGDDAHIAPNVTLCGGVSVGAGSLIGAGATVLVGRRIGTGAVVGAGSTVIEDVPDGTCAVGSPCRILESRA